MKRLTFYISFVSLLLFSNVAHSFNFNGTWSCRTGWWYYTTVELKGKYGAMNGFEGFVMESVKISGKQVWSGKAIANFLNNDIKSTENETIYLDYWESTNYETYKNEGVVVVFLSKSFSESEGTKWKETEKRHCERQ